MAVVIVTPGREGCPAAGCGNQAEERGQQEPLGPIMVIATSNELAHQQEWNERREAHHVVAAPHSHQATVAGGGATGCEKSSTGKRSQLVRLCR